MLYFILFLSCIIIILYIAFNLYLKIKENEELSKKINEMKLRELDNKNKDKKEEEKEKEIETKLQEISITNQEMNEKQRKFNDKEKEIEIREKEIKTKEEKIIEAIKTYENNKLILDKQQNELNNKINLINIKEKEIENITKEINDKRKEIEIKEKEIENKNNYISKKLNELQIKEQEIENKNIEILEKQNQLEKLSKEYYQQKDNNKIWVNTELEDTKNEIKKEDKNEKEDEEEIEDFLNERILNTDDNDVVEEMKNKIYVNPEKYNQMNQELNEYKNKNNELTNSNLQLEMKINNLEEKNKNNELDIIEDELIDESTILEGKKNIEDIKKVLEEKAGDLQGLSNFTNEDLKTKIVSMKKILDLLYKQLEDSDHRKFEYENKLIRLQNTFNEQLEIDRKEILRLYKSKKKWKNMETSFLSTGDNPFSLNNLKEGKNDEENLKNRISLLSKENKSLRYVAKDLKKKLKDLKNKNGS